MSTEKRHDLDIPSQNQTASIKILDTQNPPPAANWAGIIAAGLGLPLGFISLYPAFASPDAIVFFGLNVRAASILMLGTALATAAIVPLFLLARAHKQAGALHATMVQASTNLTTAAEQNQQLSEFITFVAERFTQITKRQVELLSFALTAMTDEHARMELEHAVSSFKDFLLVETVAIFQKIHPGHAFTANLKIILPPRPGADDWCFQTTYRCAQDPSRAENDGKSYALTENHAIVELFRHNSPDCYICNDIDEWERTGPKISNTANRAQKYNYGILHLIKGDARAAPSQKRTRRKSPLPLPKKLKDGKPVYGILCVDSKTVPFTDYDKTIIGQLAEFALAAEIITAGLANQHRSA